jgi:hypothetical protein
MYHLTAPTGWSTVTAFVKGTGREMMMNLTKVLSFSRAAALLGIGLLATVPAKASLITETFSGNFGADLFSGTITLDVVGGQALSGTGQITIFGFSNAPMVLITTGTPGNETAPGPVGFRANDGTDFGGLNTAIPIDSIGLLFDVNTTTAVFGQFPLFNLASGPNNSTFTGVVGGVEHYAVSGTAIISSPLAVPGPIVGAGLPGLFMAFGGFLAWRRKRNGDPLAA